MFERVCPRLTMFGHVWACLDIFVHIDNVTYHIYDLLQSNVSSDIYW